MFKKIFVGFALLSTLVTSVDVHAESDSESQKNKSSQCETVLIDDRQIVAAQADIRNELAHIYRKRRIVSLCWGSAAAAVTGYVVYKWFAWPEQTADAHDVDDLKYQVQQLRVAINAKQKSVDKDHKTAGKPGMIKRAWNGFKGGVGSLTRAGVYVALSGLVGSMMLPFTEKASAAIASFYKTLDLQWMLNDKTRLPHLLAELRLLAATLDPKSTVFNDLAHVNVTIANYNVARSEQRTFPVAELDDLMRLHATAQARHTIDVASCEKRLEKMWHMTVDAVTRCIGFVQLRMHEDKMRGEITDFDVQRIQNMCNHIVVCTNALTTRFTDLEKTSGLLAAVYQYSEDIMRSFSIVGDAPIIGS